MIGRDATRATGISGAAYVDFIAKAHQLGLLNDFGRVDESSTRLESLAVSGVDQRVVRISDQLFVSEQDIAELLQAKAAIAAGIRSLLERAQIEADELDHIYISGGFGYHLNMQHVCAIGLLPTLDAQCYSVLGNGSLGGASLMLLDPKLKAIAERLAAETCSVELNQEPDFEDHYIDSLALGDFE